jgi:RNA polymerase sporulation-specific sigma factor
MSGIFTAIAIFIHQLQVLVAFVKNNVFPKPLSEQEEADALRRMSEGDEAARNKLVEHNLRLVAHIVKKYDNTGQEQEDLISIGTIGLIKAIENYSPGKGTKLATFAARCIENEILMVLRAAKKTRKDVSLNEPVGTDKEGNEMSLIDLLGTDPDEVHNQVANQLERSKIYKHLHVLDVREKEVIVYRFGLVYGGEERTQREIANALGISRSYVSRIEKRALMKLYQAFMKETR